MIMLREIVLGSIIIGAFIFGAILILIYLLRWLLYEATGVQRKPRGERTLNREESFASQDTRSSGNEYPVKDPEVGEISGEGSTEAPKPPAPTPPEKKADDKRPYGPPKPEYNAADDFIIVDDGDSDSE
ncbi:hypothetical protein Bca4012_016869 [Brassica carinata]